MPVVRTLLRVPVRCSRGEERAVPREEEAGGNHRERWKRASAHTRESPERECRAASNRVVRQIERDERERDDAPQPAADTIVAGCINPPSWYPQGRASNSKVNVPGSHPPPPRFVVVVDFFFFFWTSSPSSLFFARLPFLSFVHSLSLSLSLSLSPSVALGALAFLLLVGSPPLSSACSRDRAGESHLATSGMSLPLIPPIRPWPGSNGASSRLPRFLLLLPPLLVSILRPPVLVQRMINAEIFHELYVGRRSILDRLHSKLGAFDFERNTSRPHEPKTYENGIPNRRLTRLRHAVLHPLSFH